MQVRETPPFAPVLMESTRAIGYSLEAAIADIIDNSIAAKAGKVQLFFFPVDDAYSGNKPYPYECAWSQWYQIIHAASYLRQKDKFTISNLYELIVKTNPFNVKIVETPVTFCYGKYRIKFGGRTFYR